MLSQHTLSELRISLKKLSFVLLSCYSRYKIIPPLMFYEQNKGGIRDIV